ncbi:MAG: AAA family ATPase, partial [Firmicutes bacterium]|nr:AAA family ATPase [Bacillota bacterium]
MANKKDKTVFVCQNCGFESPRWMGQCSACGAWNSFVEEKLTEPKEGDSRRRTGPAQSGKRSRPVAIDKVVSGQTSRMDTGIPELNRVLGGGLVQGSLALISGEPGIGKSTIIIQAAANIAQKYGT